MGSGRRRFGAELDEEQARMLPGLLSSSAISRPLSTDGSNIHSSRSFELDALDRSVGFCLQDTLDLSRNPTLNSGSNSRANESYPIHSTSYSKIQWVTSPKGQQSNPFSQSGRTLENWGESPTTDASPRTDASTDGDMEERHQKNEAHQSAADMPSESSDKSKTDQKTLRRLAQNREAARKSRLKKKAYVQQLESSRLKLNQMEQELQQARQQGIFISGDQSHLAGGNAGSMDFDMEYARWFEEQTHQVNELRAAFNSRASDNDLLTIIKNVITHYGDIFRLKAVAAKADVFHILYGMWKTPAERCFLWIGGFRSSELLKILESHLEPLTEHQLREINNLQVSSQQAEDVLSRRMEVWQQSLAETLANEYPDSSGFSDGNVANYMGQMDVAMAKLATLEGFLLQADNLRQQTLQQLHSILTTRQSGRAILAMHEYFTRLRALSSLWLARPRE